MPLIYKTIGQILDENTEKYSNQAAVVYVDENLRFSWLELKDMVDTTAKAFMALGVKKGKHIAIWGTNKPEWLITQLAAAKIGAGLVTINPEWKANELEYALKQSDSKVLVMIEGFEKKSGDKLHRYEYLKILIDACPEIVDVKDKERLATEAQRTQR
ncbi:MAG: AMP-binding protein [candidate division WOR-3 bacterium]|nr:AMP-binding protein [candidate division WOR-3 bacterium]MDH5683900.1 AMP-binding protein [candidate division WOR-3 bacterium]